MPKRQEGLTMANHYHKQGGHKRGLIDITLAADGWNAVFYNVQDMPERISLPLPFTAGASADMVLASMRDRFNAHIELVANGGRTRLTA